MSLPNLSSNNWFFYDNLKNFGTTPSIVTILDKQYIGYLDKNDQVVVTLNYCPHRGYPLAKGKIKKQELECSYHGWRFSDNGKCSKIPGCKKAPNIKLKTFKTYSTEGLVWINIANSDIPFPKIKKLENSVSELNYSYRVKASTYLIIENTLDPLHTSFVHRGWVRSSNRKKVKIQINVTPNQVEAVYLNEGTQTGVISKIFSSDEDIGIGRYVHPGILQLEYRDAKKTKLLITSYLTPVNEFETSVYVRMQYIKQPLRLDIFLKPVFNIMIKHVLNQDLVVVEEQQQNLLELDKEHFVSTELDFLNKYLREIINSDGNAITSNELIEIDI